MNILFIQKDVSCIRNYKYAFNLNKRGHSIYLLSGISPMDYYNLSYDPYTKIYYDEINNNNIRNIINENKIDAIHYHNRPDYLIDDLASFGIPVVYDLHDYPKIPLYNLPNVTYVTVSEPMSDKFCRGFKNIVIPPIMLKENNYKPVDGGKIMYMGSFYWKSRVPKIIDILKKVSLETGRDIDIFCSSREFWDDIKEYIKNESTIHFKGMLSIDTFVNKEYEYGLVESVSDTRQNEYCVPVKLIDYLSFGLKIYRVDIDDKVYKINMSNKDMFRFNKYYDFLIKAYLGEQQQSLIDVIHKRKSSTTFNTIHFYDYLHASSKPGSINISYVRDLPPLQLEYIKKDEYDIKICKEKYANKFREVDGFIVDTYKMAIHTQTLYGVEKPFRIFANYPLCQEISTVKRNEIVYIDNSGIIPFGFKEHLFLLDSITKKFGIPTIFVSSKFSNDARCIVLDNEYHVTTMSLEEYDYCSEYGILMNTNNFNQAGECLPRKFLTYIMCGMKPIVDNTWLDCIDYLYKNNINPYIYDVYNPDFNDIDKHVFNNIDGRKFCIENNITDLCLKLKQLEEEISR